MEAVSSTSSLSVVPSAPLPQDSAVTRTVRKTNRSRRSALLQSTVKLISPRILKFPPPIPAPDGSPELKPPESIFEHCNVRQRQIGKVKIRIYEINARSSKATRENFIPAQIQDLKTEQIQRHNASSYEPTASLRQIQSHEVEQVIARDFASSQDRRRRKHIYYFAGGGWQSSASPEHWKLCAHLAHGLTRRGHPTTVSIVSYPLAPHSPAQKTLPMLELFYYEILPSTPPSSIGAPAAAANGTANSHSDVGDPAESLSALSLSKTRTRYMVQDEDVIFAGDSAGGNVALSLVLNILFQNPRARVPSRLLLISPAVDLRNSNPEMVAISRRDPVLGKATVDQTAGAWCAGGTDPSDPRVSPLLRDMGILARRNVSVDCVIGGYDVLAPDARLLRDKCRDAGVHGEWLEWDKMMHCFPLAFAYGMLPEANEAVEWCLRRLMSDN